MSSYDIDERALAQLVERKVKLTCRGRVWRGPCPFHVEKTPNFAFAVFRSKRTGKGRFHCFSCGANGDAIDWMRLMEGRTFAEARAETEDPEVTAAAEGARRYEERRQAVLRRYRDCNPDCCLPDWAIDTTKPYNATRLERES